MLTLSTLLSPPSQSHSRFVEIGRVVMINFGKEEGKLATIIDVVDANRALIDGPHAKTGVKRQMLNFKRMSLTDIKVAIPRNARQKTLCKAFDDADVLGVFAASSWGRKIERKRKRTAMNDFDRFKLMLAKKKKAKAVRTTMKKMQKDSNA